MQSIVILGRQPALGLAELESLYGATILQPVGDTAALLEMAAATIDFKRLGGAIKLAKVLATSDKTDWRGIESQLLKLIPTITEDLPDGKLHLGLSSYGFSVSPHQLTATGLTLKKTIRKTNHGVHLIPNNAAELSSAQVFHNKLTGEHGRELLIIRDGEQTIIAQTTAVQDIDSYTLRDRGRPKRDARVGMLPPKLAQIIINLATAQADPLYGDVVLDPFCGTGVILSEATMMGFDIYGSDLDPRMVEYSDKNLLWLLNQPNCPVSQPAETTNNPDWRYFSLEQGDATSHTWTPMPTIVACETYLGRPFTTPPDAATLATTIGDCNLIISKFLRNIRSQLKPGTHLCIAVPAWQIRPSQFKHLPLVDSLEEMGYNQVRFEHVQDDQLLYYREDQIVARQLLVLTRN